MANERRLPGSFIEPEGESPGLAAIVATLPGIVYCGPHDRTHTLVYVSQGCHELTGYTASQLTHSNKSPYSDLIHPDDKDAVFTQIATAVAQDKPYRCIYRLLRADGEERWVMERGRAVSHSHQGDLLVGFVTDHTDRMELLQAQSNHLAIMEERNRLARELHDSVSQALYSVTLFAEAGRTFAQGGELARAANYFDDILETGQQALKEMRLLLHKLRPSRLEQAGLVQAIQHRLNAVEGRAGIRNHIIVEGKISLSPDIEEAIYLIALEALNNSIKHAGAHEVLVRLEQSELGSVLLQVEDDGCGFDHDTAFAGGGLGLTSMQERIAMLGGDLSISSGTERGTVVQARLQVSGDVR